MNNIKEVLSNKDIQKKILKKSFKKSVDTINIKGYIYVGHNKDEVFDIIITVIQRMCKKYCYNSESINIRNMLNQMYINDIVYTTYEKVFDKLIERFYIFDFHGNGNDNIKSVFYDCDLPITNVEDLREYLKFDIDDEDLF